MNWIRNHKKAVIAGGAAVLVVIAFLAFGVFGVQTLFIDDKVSEANPFADSADVATTEVTEAPDPDASPPETTVAAAAEPEIVTLASGQFESRDHPSSGLATVITDGDRTFLRFEDDFATDNGPDLNVYLTTADADADAGDFGAGGQFVDLGDLKGNIGSQNYEIPTDVDLDRYSTVVIWCVRFGVVFTSASLA